VAAWVCFGALHLKDSSWSWKMCVLFQVIIPFPALVAVPVIPESPRFLVSKGRVEEPTTSSPSTMPTVIRTTNWFSTKCRRSKRPSISRAMRNRCRGWLSSRPRVTVGAWRSLW
jgi:hypothetical protein